MLLKKQSHWEHYLDKKKHCRNVKKYQQKQRDAWNRLSEEEKGLLIFRKTKELMEEEK